MPAGGRRAAPDLRAERSSQLAQPNQARHIEQSSDPHLRTVAQWMAAHGMEAAAGQGAGQKAQEFLDALRAFGIPHARARSSAIVTASMGIAVGWPTETASSAALLSWADRSRYAARCAGRNGWGRLNAKVSQ